MTPAPPDTDVPARVSPMLFVGMFLAASLAPLGSTMIAVALPSIGGELGIDSGRLSQWLVNSYLVVGIAVMSPAGRLGDLIGHRRGLVLGMAIYGVGAVVGFTVATLESLAFARIAMAVGGALMVPATLALLRNAVDEARRPRVFGYFGAVMGTAAAIGPLLGGELTAHFGWRSVFIANVPVILLAYLLVGSATRARTVAPAQPPTAGAGPAPRFDVLGSVLLGAGLTLLVIAAQSAGPTAAAEAALGVMVLAAFVWWERRVPQPVMDLRLFAQATFASSTAVIGLQNLAMYALLFQLPIFFEQARDATAGITGRALVAMMAAMVVCSPLGGRVSERWGARATVFTGTLICLAGVCLLSDVQALLTPADALPGLVLVGAGLGLSTPPAQAAAMSAASRGNAGMAGGAVSTARYVGGVAGISALGYLLAGDPASVDAHGSATLVYAAALIAAAIGALALPGRIRAAPAAP